MTTRIAALIALGLVLFLSACGSDDNAPDGSLAPQADASRADAAQLSPDIGTPPGLDASHPALDTGVPPGPDASAGPDPTKACNDAAALVCNKISTCSPFGISAVYGDLATCKTRYVLACLPSFTGSGTHQTPAKTETCANSLAALDCASFLTLSFGAACAPEPGDLANNAACGDDGQCQSTFCARGPNSQCGTCAPVTSAGSACINGACSTGTTCPTGSNKCITPVAGQLNANCTYQAQCDLAHGVGCNTQSSKCIQLEVSGDGTCGLDLVSGNYVICPASGTCDATLGGSCSSVAGDGKTCGTGDTDPHCLAPARCVSGKCALPDPTKCK